MIEDLENVDAILTALSVSATDIIQINDLPTFTRIWYSVA
jgi:hypothetical protein